MIKIEPHDINDVDLLDKVIDERNSPLKEKLLSIKTIWKQRYEQYTSYLESDISIGASPKDFLSSKSSIIDLYDKPRGLLKDKIELIRSNENCCPLCGTESTPDTLDHFLPKEEFPEFAFMTKNLYICCASCNVKKSVLFGERYSERFTINPMFDELCGKRLYDFEVMLGKSILFNPVVSSSLSVEEKNLVQRHFHNLQLTKKLRKVAESQFRMDRRYALQLRSQENDYGQIKGHFGCLKGRADVNPINHVLRVYYSVLLTNEELFSRLVENGSLSVDHSKAG